MDDGTLATAGEKYTYNQTLGLATQTVQKLVSDDGWNYTKYNILVTDGVIRIEVEISND